MELEKMSKQVKKNKRLRKRRRERREKDREREIDRENERERGGGLTVPSRKKNALSGLPIERGCRGSHS